MKTGILDKKRGLIFGAVDERSLAWHVAHACIRDGAEIVLTNTPTAIELGSIRSLADEHHLYNEKVDIRYSASITLLLELKDRVNTELEKKTALSLKSLAVNGHDLMEIGVPAGKELGRILNELLNCVIEDPAMNTREILLETAKKISRI